MDQISCSVDRKKDKVAIVGFAQSTRHQAPFYDDDFEIWGLNELYMVIPRFDRWFEMHSRQEFERSFRNSHHLDWLRQCRKPIYMQRKHKSIPSSVEYPIKRMVAEFGSCFRSTICYMLALAIDEGFRAIHLYGVDLDSEKEYSDQRPSGEYFLGLARGRGIEVYVPEDSALLRGRLYGYDHYSLAERYQIRLNELSARREKLQNELSFLSGIIDECQGMTNASATKNSSSAMKLSLSGKRNPQRIAELQQQHNQLTREASAVSGAIQECHYWLSRVDEEQSHVV